MNRAFFFFSLSKFSTGTVQYLFGIKWTVLDVQVGSRVDTVGIALQMFLLCCNPVMKTCLKHQKTAAALRAEAAKGDRGVAHMVTL